MTWLQVAELLEPGEFEVFSPGDICPDNNLLTAGGVRFIDFESADFHTCSWTRPICACRSAPAGAYSRCRPVSRREAEAAYRKLVSSIFAELADDGVWSRGLRLATAAWTLHAMTYLLDRAVEGDASMTRIARQAPTKRRVGDPVASHAPTSAAAAAIPVAHARRRAPSIRRTPGDSARCWTSFSLRLTSGRYLSCRFIRRFAEAPVR